MSPVTIYRCPVCSEIRKRTDDVVKALQRDGIVSTIINGAEGEFRVTVRANTVITKKSGVLPSTEDIVHAVERETDAEVLAS